jgi:GDPmannose 4,6-dehydratase
MADTSRLDQLALAGAIELQSMVPTDFRSVLRVVSAVAPAEIYNLAGQTSVGLSFEQPVECMESIAGASLILLEVIRYLNAPVRLFNAGSSECFGDTGTTPANEDTPFKPRSPYAVAKSTAFWQVRSYREAYGIHACTGILANHESPLRPLRFVTQKIIRGVREIAAGKRHTLQLGNLDVWRDWGWAPDYVEAMHRMLQHDTANDYVIASGTTRSLRDFVELAFAQAGLAADDHVEIRAELMRPSDLAYSALDPSRINTTLGWQASYGLEQIVEAMYAEVPPP